MTDYTVGDTCHFMFTTRQFSTGAPFTLAGTPAVSAYEDNSVTQITAGITLGVDHDSVTGLNLLTVVATGANGFETGKDYHLVITTGTVDSVSVVGEVVGRFTLGRSAAAVDLANGTDGLGAIKAETAAIVNDTDVIDDATSGLVKIAQDVAAVLVDTADIQPKIGTVTDLGGGATLGANNSDMAGATFATATDSQEALRNRGDAAWITATGFSTHSAADVWSVATRVLTAGTNIVLAKGTGVTGFNDLSAAQVNAEADTALADYDPPTNTEMVAAFTEIKGATWATTDTLEAIRDRGDAAWITATSVTVSDKTGFSLASTGLDLVTAWTVAITGNVTGNLSGSIGSLGATAKTDVSTAVLTTQMTEAYAANGVAPTLAQAQFAMHQMLMQFGISGTSLTVKKLDDTTTAFVVTLDSATTPTAAART